jgi:hypothetical protein
MATWIAHMRIAEHFMNLDERLNCVEFLVGNIGPDCGVPNDDWSSFTPDGNITHWKLDGNTIDAEDFKTKYLVQDRNGFIFYFGYYFHLLVDIAWSSLYDKKKLEPIHSEGLKANPSFIWTIKKDWYGQDENYLHFNPDSVFFRMFQNIETFENSYFDFYPQNAFTRQIHFITNRYLSAKADINRDYLFVSKEEMDAFVDNTITSLHEIYCDIIN